jgi:hypothetical protein
LPTYDSALQSALSAQTTKISFSNTLVSMLGPTCVVRGLRNGVEFMNVGASGAITVVAGNIIKGWGVLTGVTTNLAADVSTGTCVLRIEGGGHFVEYTLGLGAASGKEQYFARNPDGVMGVAFASTAGLKAPLLLDSGTGFGAPPDNVYTVDFQNWSSGSAVAAGTLTLSSRIPNWVYDDAQQQTSIGDCRTHQCPQSVVMGDVEFGALYWGMNQNVNSEGAFPVDEILIISKPTEANWPGHPKYSGYIVGTSNTFPPAFKAVVRKNGAVVKTFEMRDGLPMNSPQLNHGGGDLSVAPIRPFYCTGQVLLYRSARPKLHTFAAQLHAGYEADVIRSTVTREKASSNGINPLFSFRDQLNSYNQWFAMPKWAIPANLAAMNADTVSIQDAFLYPVNAEIAPYGAFGYGGVRVTGWGYEPGTNGGMDWHTGPGGSRSDRGVVATPIALYLTNPAYIRPRGNDTIQDMVDAWNMNYCNVPNHLYADVKTGATIPENEVFGAMGSANYWSQGGNTYYGSIDTFVTAGRAGISNGQTGDYAKPYAGAFIDKNGLMPFHGGLTDYSHAYKSPALSAMIFNSPALAHLAKHAAINTILAQIGDVPPDTDPTRFFLVRNMAWRWKPYADNWKLSTDHPWGLSRKLIEDRFQIELETIYDSIVKPVLVDNTQHPYYNALRNLGVPSGVNNAGTAWETKSQALTFYVAGVLHLMKTTGLWDVMMAKSYKCNQALRFTIRCLDLYAIDWILDTDGRYDWYVNTIKGSNTGANTNVVYANWAEYAPIEVPVNGLNDWITNPDGTNKLEQEPTQHARYQYLTLRKLYITEAEIPCARANGVDLALAKYRNFYSIRWSRVTAATTNDNKRRADFAYRWPGFGGFKPPAP